MSRLVFVRPDDEPRREYRVVEPTANQWRALMLVAQRVAALTVALPWLVLLVGIWLPEYRSQLISTGLVLGVFWWGLVAVRGWVVSEWVAAVKVEADALGIERPKL